MNTQTLRRMVAGTLCGTVAVAGAYAPFSYTTPRAEAFFGDIALATKELVTDPIFWMIARTAVNSMSQSIVNWINSGFEGSPAFVTDLEQNLGNLADAVADDFLRGLDEVVENNIGGGASVRAPFQDQITRALREEFYRTTSSYGFNVRNPYQDCYGGGGFNFNGFLCQSQNPANNPFGRYQLARNELFQEIDKETQNRLREIGYGNGFLSWRGPCGPNARPAAPGEPTSLNTAERNRSCPIRTPGAVIEESLGITVGSPLRQLELADEFNEILAALMNQMVNQVLGGGGVTGLSEPAPGGGPSFINRAADPSQFSQQISSTLNGVLVNMRQFRGELESHRNSWQRIASAAATAEQACRSSNRAGEAASVRMTAQAQIDLSNRTLNDLASLETRISTAGAAGDGVSASALVAEFNALLGTSIDPEYARQQSADTGDADPGSLYSQMIRLAATCR